MPRGSAQQGLLVAWLGLVVMQIARASGGQSGFQWPPPRVIIAPAVVYSGLSLLALASSPLAVALGVGIDLAVAINPAVMPQTNALLSRVVGVSKSGAGNAPSAAAPSNPNTSSAPAYPIVVGGGNQAPAFPVAP